jgi:hypothetical protein
MTYLWTSIPFAIFFIVIVWFEAKHKKREKKIDEQTAAYVRPIARVTNSLHQKTYGRPSTEIEQTFPEIKASK